MYIFNISGINVSKVYSIKTNFGDNYSFLWQNPNAKLKFFDTPGNRMILTGNAIDTIEGIDGISKVSPSEDSIIFSYMFTTPGNFTPNATVLYTNLYSELAGNTNKKIEIISAPVTKTETGEPMSICANLGCNESFKTALNKCANNYSNAFRKDDCESAFEDFDGDGLLNWEECNYFTNDASCTKFYKLPAVAISTYPISIP